ncbi:MAG: MarR family transcriptional regulator [Lentisphaeria bacterium]|nr:MarR family transcriptional regulator [Lentisphaeria bacterium]
MEDKRIENIGEWADIWRQCDVAYTQLMRHFNVSANTYCVLELLLNNPDGVSPAEIADAAIIKRQMVALILNDLENRGWIIRKELKTDHRRKKIFLTKAGKEQASGIVRITNGVALQGIKIMKEDEQAQFLALARRFACSLQQEIDRVVDKKDILR